MEQLTDERLNEIEARADAATSGPWFIAARTEDWIEGPEEVLAIDSCDQEGIAHLYDPLSSANGDFIAHAREDVPALAAEVRRLQRVAAAAKAYRDAEAKLDRWLEEGHSKAVLREKAGRLMRDLFWEIDTM